MHLLHDQFREVWIPRAVETELHDIPEPVVQKTVDEALRTGWLKTRAASQPALVSLLKVELHPEEAEAIALG